MASGNCDLNNSWVMLCDPRHNADKRLIIVETDDEHLLVSGAEVLVFAPNAPKKFIKIKI